MCKLFGVAMAIGLQPNEERSDDLKLFKYIGVPALLPEFLQRNSDYVKLLTQEDHVEIAFLGQLKGARSQSLFKQRKVSLTYIALRNY